MDKWVLIPGRPWQQEMALGLDHASCCVVCIGGSMPDGWFKEEIQKALNRQTKDPSFRVIPMLLPGSRDEYINDFLELRTWIDFRDKTNNDYEFYRLVCGAKGIPPGRWHTRKPDGADYNDSAELKLNTLAELHQKNLIIDDVFREYQCKILDVHLMGK